MGLPPSARGLPLPAIVGKVTASESEESRIATASDEELLASIARKDALALQELVNRYSRLIMRIAARILHDYGESEELMQEVFLYVYQKAAYFDAAKGAGRGWILQLTYHRAFDRRAYLNRRAFYAGTDASALADTLLADTDLDRDVGLRLSREQLDKAFRDLPERQRRTLELFYFEGLER